MAKINPVWTIKVLTHEIQSLLRFRVQAIPLESEAPCEDNYLIKNLTPKICNMFNHV